jgi:hypothetical protein
VERSSAGRSSPTQAGQHAAASDGTSQLAESVHFYVGPLLQQRRRTDLLKRSADPEPDPDQSTPEIQTLLDHAEQHGETLKRIDTTTQEIKRDLGWGLKLLSDWYVGRLKSHPWVWSFINFLFGGTVGTLVVEWVKARLSHR